MAHLDIETSNQIFDVLADWEHVLQALFRDAVNPYDEEEELENDPESEPQP